MSMSTLGAQLAALNSSSNSGLGAGSTLPTSKRHEDAVGRGVNFSVQLGYATAASKDPKFRPSIIYQDSKQAADVPLETIKENCVSSLRQLQESCNDEAFGNFIGPLCKKANERGLLTAADNSKVDSIIEDLLYRLSLRMGNTGTKGFDSTTFASCLHVIEYLLRKFDIHIRPKTAATALLVMLPHHEQPFFLRLLQLIDLASLPIWSFLRPYAVPNAYVSRLVITKQVAKDVALLRDVCKLAQQNAKLGKSSHDDIEQQSLSFTAAVIVEALTSQLQTTGSVEEKSLQAILPYAVAAVNQESSPEYIQWGYVIASTIVECCVLAQEPRNVLITSILQGLSKFHRTKDAIGTTMMNNGLLVALTILVQPTNSKEDSDQLLPVGSSMYGFASDKHIYRQLCSLNQIVERLATLHEEFFEVRHLIASILVFGWHLVHKQFNRTDSKPINEKTKRRLDNERQILLGLIASPKLQSELWKINDGEWIESYCSYILTHTSLQKEGKSDSDDFTKKVLEKLRQLNPSAYEKGIVHALVRSKKEDRVQIAEWLGLKKDNPSSDALNSDDVDTYNLPPRVALEHAEASVRLEAIPRVLKEAMDESNMDIDADDDSLLEALLRRFVSDDNVDVALGGAEASLKLLEKQNKNGLDFQEDALGALHRWAEDSNIDNESRSKLLQHALRICTKCITPQQHPSVQLIEGIASFMNDISSVVSQEAAKAVYVCLKKGDSSRVIDYAKQASLLLMSDDSLLEGFQRKWSGSDTQIEKVVRRRVMPILLKAFMEGQQASKKQNKNREKQARSVVTYCSWAIASFSQDMQTSEKECLSECLLVTSKNVAVQTENISTWFHTLADVDETFFSEVLAKYFKTVCDDVKTKKGDSVPGIAILLEAALSSPSSTVINNLLQVVSLYTATGDETESLQHGFIQTLALVAHTDAAVRQRAADIICDIGNVLSKQKGSEWATLNKVSQYIRDNKSFALLGGQQFLPNLFGSVSHTSKKVDEKFLGCILSLCVCSATACTPAKSSSIPVSIEENSWLDIAQANGGHIAAWSILKATKLAGEAACPISLRWEYAGKFIVDALMGSGFSRSVVPNSLSTLIDEVVYILKGVKENDATSQTDSVIITSGPTYRGGRSRSYSFGKMDSVHFWKPYPKDMQDSIISILFGMGKNMLNQQIGKSLFFSILCSKSWGEHVFTGLPRSFILEVGSALLVATAESGIDGGEETFFALPLQPIELSGLLENHIEGPTYFASYLSDYISNNAARLSTDTKGNVLFSPLFKNLKKLSSKTIDDDGSNEFARQSLTEAILDLVKTLPANTLVSSFAKPQILGDWVSLLVDLISGHNPNIRTLETLRSRKSNLQLLASLCTRFPAVIVEKLLPAMSAILSSATSEKEAKLASESLSIIVPVFFQNSKSTKMSPGQTINAFLFASKNVSDSKIRVLLYRAFADAIAKCPGTLLGPFVSSCLACEASLSTDSAFEDISLDQLTGQLLINTPIETQIDSLWTIINYSRDILLGVDDADESSFDLDILSTASLVTIARDGPSKDVGNESTMVGISHEDHTVLRLCAAMMNAVLEIVASQAFRKFVRRIDGNKAAPVLRFWQALLLLQASYNSVSGRSALKAAAYFQETIGIAINDTLTSLHSSLPAHIFLAFATNLIKEGDNEELRARAVQLVAEGAATLKPSDNQAGLYRDMIPFLTTIVAADGKDSPGILVRQTAFVTVESIVRLLCIPAVGSNDVKKRMGKFIQLLTKSANVLDGLCAPLDSPEHDFGSIPTPSKQLFCSASLCVATTVRICEHRSIAALSKLMKPLHLFLSAANLWCMSSDSTVIEDSRLVQLSILCSLCSLVEKLPQFLHQHLPVLFGETGLPCRVLRKSDNDRSLSIKEAATKFETILASKVPARLLVPPATKALINLNGDDEVLAMLSILIKSVDHSRGAELAALSNQLIKAATFGFEHEGVTSLEHPRVVASTELLTSLILKLSEVQLRTLYTKLRTWKSDMDKSDPAFNATRRVAFWSLSAGLAQRLKSIYLPCLASVFSDAVDELVSSISFVPFL